MGIFKDVYNSMFRKKDIDPSLFDEADDIKNGWRSNNGTVVASNKSLLYKDLVYKCIDITAQKVASNTYFFKDGNKDLDINKAIELSAFKSPNSLETFYDILYATVTYKKLYGIGFWYCPKFKGENTRARIYCLDPKRVTVVLNTDPTTQMTTPISKYLYMNNNSQTEFTPDEIVPFFNFNLTGQLVGQGDVDYLFETIKENKYIQVYTNSFFENSARPDYVLEAPETIDEVTGKTIIDKMEARFKGTKRSFRPVVLTNGLKINKLSWSNQDANLSELKTLNRDEILALFGVPKGIMYADDVNLANSKSAYKNFMEFTVWPELLRIQHKINKFFFTFKPSITMTFENPTPQDAEIKLAEDTASVNKWKTVNEIRKERGYEPLDKKYDELQAPTSMFGSISDTTPTEPANTDNINSDSGKSKSFENEENAIKGAGHVPLFSKVKVAQLDIQVTSSEDRRQKLWEQMNEKALNEEKKIKSNMKDEFEREKTEALNKLSKKGITKDITSTDLINRPYAQKTIINFLSDSEIGLIKRNGVEALTNIGSDINFETNTPRIKKFIKNNMQRVSDSILDTTYDLLQNELDSGKTGTELTDGIKSLFDGMAETRADVIARSESILSSNYGLQEGYKQGGVEVKEWYATEDERECEYCSALHNETKDITDDFLAQGDVVKGTDGGEFTADYRSIDVPPLHANCRCVLIPVVDNQ